MRRLTLAVIVVWGAALSAQAQTAAPPNPPAPAPVGQPSGGASPSVTRSVDPDVDFARAMVALHERSIQTARTQMTRGRDRKLRKLARRIVAMQRRELSFLREWLATNAR